jgi:hypothetical protein
LGIARGYPVPDSFPNVYPRGFLIYTVYNSSVLSARFGQINRDYRDSGFFTSRTVGGILTREVMAIGQDGEADLVTIQEDPLGPGLSVDYDQAYGLIEGVQYADADDYRVYTINRRGVLAQWWTIGDPSSGYYWDHKIKIGKKYANLTSLTIANRLTIRGVKTDVL